MGAHAPTTDVTIACASPLARASSSDCVGVSRGAPPALPRGSSLYESLMAEFGVDEEERDTLSPLPSPEVRRRAAQRSRHHHHHHHHHPHHVDEHMPALDIKDDDALIALMTSAQTSPQHQRRHVHWSQDAKFNKFNKKKAVTS